MHYLRFITGLFFLINQIPITISEDVIHPSFRLFSTLEEHSRLVDIAYCVLPNPFTPGITPPFKCLSPHCSSFPSFQLITQWNTGPLMTDSSGYIVISHPPAEKRIIVAFRGTYSLTNTLIDLATLPQTYIPYPTAPPTQNNTLMEEDDECKNCTVHLGFWSSWKQARSIIMPHINSLREVYKDYRIVLVGHSLGGAVAGLAGLEMEVRGWMPEVTTFGEPRVGNQALMSYFDTKFGISKEYKRDGTRYRRVTHLDDPVPLLPLSEWNYRSHAGEIYINKAEIPPELNNLIICHGDVDKECSAGADNTLNILRNDQEVMMAELTTGIEIPLRYQLWQLLHAHRDYFWRLGLCIPDI